MVVENSNIDIQDILYGGIAGEMPLPDILPDTDEDILLSDPKYCQASENQSEPEIMTYVEAISAARAEPTADIRPRIFDGVTQEWILLDTGSQCSVTKATPSDKIRPDLKLETVDGSRLHCFGTRPFSLRLGRKTYHINTAISNTTDTILGMDFLDKYGFEFRRGEFGDLYLYDPKSQTSHLCQFIKSQESLPPKISALRLASIPISSGSTDDLVPSSSLQATPILFGRLGRAFSFPFCHQLGLRCDL